MRVSPLFVSYIPKVLRGSRTSRIEPILLLFYLTVRLPVAAIYFLVSVWLAENGLPLNVLQETGAWKSEGMVRWYAHLAAAQLVQHGEVITSLVDGTIAAHPANEGELITS